MDLIDFQFHLDRKRTLYLVNDSTELSDSDRIALNEAKPKKDPIAEYEVLEQGLRRFWFM